MRNHATPSHTSSQTALRIARIPFAMASGLAPLALASQLCAQGPGSGPAAVAFPALSDAPQPNVAVASTETADHHSVAPDAQAGSINGTVTDMNGDLVPGATVVLDSAVSGEHHGVIANDNGWFAFSGLEPGTSYHVTISAPGFADWSSPAVVLTPGQFVLLKDIDLKIEGGETSVTVSSSSEEIAAEQVKLELHQRVLGIIPNFYVVYDQNAAPLTTKLKFTLASRAAVDPVTAAGVVLLAGINQAAGTPDYAEGLKGFGQRVGALSAHGLTGIMIGDAILPSLLHQDPRYFYRGTGTTKSRLNHALFSPFICKGDNGRWQPNYSSMGGDLASSAISNVYYPQSNRGAGLVFGNFAIGTAERMISGVAQEFILRKFTPSAKYRD
jgi:hypothetical protein